MSTSRKRTSHDTYKERRSYGVTGRQVTEERRIDLSNLATEEDKTTIKSKLNTILNDLEVKGGEDISKEDVKDLIELLVSYSSELMIRGGEVLQRVLIHYCNTYGEHSEQIKYDGNMDLGKKEHLDIGDLLNNQTFYRQILNPGGGREVPVSIVEDVRRRYFSNDVPDGQLSVFDNAGIECLRGPPIEPLQQPGLTPTILDWKASEMMTVTLNHFILNFFNYQSATIKAMLCSARGSANVTLVKKIRDKINGKNVDIDSEGSAVRNFVNMHRLWLGFRTLEEELDGLSVVPNNEVYIEYSKNNVDYNTKWIKKNLSLVVRYFYKMAKFNEGHKFGKALQICPIFEPKMHHMTICTTMLYCIMRAVGYIGSDIKKATFRKPSNREIYWKLFMDFEQFESNTDSVSTTFSYYLTTNGVEVSIIMDRKSIVPVSTGSDTPRSVASILATVPRSIDEVRRLCQDENILGEYQVMAIDPGIVQIAATHVKEVDGTTTSTTITSRMIRSVSGSRRRVKKANKRNSTHPTLLSLQALPSRKTVDHDILNLRHKLLYSTQAGVVSLYDRRKEEYELPRHRNVKFTAFCRKQSVYASIVHSLSTSNSPLLLLFEDASFSSTMSGNAPVAVSLFKKLCKEQHIVVDVPRWMTSQTCPRCFSRFGKTIKIVDGKVRSVRGLLCCQSKQCKSACYFDRDMTSAEVIYFVGTTPEEDLPDILCEDKRNDRPQRPPYHVLRV